jgi:nucleotide-binding universal stress UspA family protein
MNARNILVPLDIAACPQEVFSLLNDCQNEGAANVTLLYVSRLNVLSPENRLYVELEQEIQAILLRLKAEFVNPRVDASVCVRSGRPAHEIVAQAAASKSDLIVLTNNVHHRRKRLFNTDIVDQVIATAPCPVRVVRVDSRLNFRTDWTPIDKELATRNCAPALLAPGWRHLAPACSRR